jgi:hypothetical protein
MSIHPWRIVSFVVLTLAASCGVPQEGQGLGRPTFSGRAQQERQGAAFSRLVAPNAQGPDDAMVELVHRGSQVIDTQTTPYYLQTAAGSIPLPATLWQPGSTLQVRGAALTPLDLHNTVGDILLLGHHLNVEAYAVWGADPNTLPGGFASLARSVGLATDWRPLPYPLAAQAAINLDANNADALCVTADANAGPLPLPAAACDAAGGTASVWISRVVPAGLNAAGSSIELYNPGSAPVDLQGLQLCGNKGCAPLIPLNQDVSDLHDTWLPGAAASIAQGAPDAARRRIVLAFGTPQNDNDLVTALPAVGSHDEVALLMPGRGANDTQALLAYVRLSKAPHVLTSPNTLLSTYGDASWSAAWQNSTLQAPLLPGEALALYVGAPTAPKAPDAWTLDAGPMGTSLADPNATYTACSVPAHPGTVSPMALVQITPRPDGAFFILDNLSSQPLDLAPYALALTDDANIALALATDAQGQRRTQLPPQESLWVALSHNEDCPKPFDLCWPSQVASLAGGALTLLRDGSPVAHVRWGAPEISSKYSEAAQAAGVWPAPACRVRGFTGDEDDAVLVRLPDRTGFSPADYALADAPRGNAMRVAR